MTDLQRYGENLVRIKSPLSRRVQERLNAEFHAIAKKCSRDSKIPTHRFFLKADRERIIKFRPRTMDELLKLNVSREERRDFNQQVLLAVYNAEQEQEQENRYPANLSNVQLEFEGIANEDTDSMSDEGSEQDCTSDDQMDLNFDFFDDTAEEESSLYSF